MNKTLLRAAVVGMIVLLAVGIVAVVRFERPIQIPGGYPGQQPIEESKGDEPPQKFFQYIEIYNACNWTNVGACVNMRAGPGTEYPVVGRLRNGVVLRVRDSVVIAGQRWYRIDFGRDLRFPERVKGDAYVASSDSTKVFTETGDQFATSVDTSTNKRIVVNISQETLYAFEGDTLFMQELISTGKEFTPTPKGTFYVLKKTPSRYMQGPIEGLSDQYYDLPGVPWDLYFNKGGAVIHGAYWHDNFGQPWSHGCVNLRVEHAEKLYKWADPGTPVIVEN